MQSWVGQCVFDQLKENIRGEANWEKEKDTVLKVFLIIFTRLKSKQSSSD